MSLTPSSHDFGNPCPLDVFEHVCALSDLACERLGDEELGIAIEGQWTTYQMRLVWRESDQTLQLVCLFDQKVAETKRAAMYETIGLINERLWLGHFEMWSGGGDLLFRHAALLDADTGVSAPQAEALVEAAMAECEKFFPVFNFVLWAGKSPQDAMQAAMLETVGEA
jgi:hypothetical protein